MYDKSYRYSEVCVWIRRVAASEDEEQRLRGSATVTIELTRGMQASGGDRRR
jgi:hypothetical protein